MKSKLTLLATLALLVMNACTTPVGVAGTQVSVGVYEQIPLAPNVVLTVETPVVAPGANYVWIEGYWTWNYDYREYVWVQGHWELTPYVGAYWIPGYWNYYGGGYRWVDACWLPRNYSISFGYCAGRYDYYGRPVYYQRPGEISGGFAYSYDHRQDYRGRGYSSSRVFNDEPSDVRKKETQTFYRESTSARRASTNRSSQNEIKIREDNSAVRTSSSSSASSSGSRTSSSATTSSGASRESSSSNAATSTGSRTSSSATTSSGASRESSSANTSTSTGSRTSSSATTNSSGSRVSSGSASGTSSRSSSAGTSSGTSRSSSSSGTSSSSSSRSSSSGGGGRR